MASADTESFTEETLRLWHEYPELNGRSRQRPSPEKLIFIGEVLRGVYVGDATSCNKSQVRARYKISNDMLQYIPENGRPPRTVITDDEAYGLIVESHLNYGHAGREKVFHYLKDKFYHITREEVGWVLKQCAKCKARCKPTEPHDTLPKTTVNHNIETMARNSRPAPQENENVLPGAYTKKFQALKAESQLDESEWTNLCLSVAKDVRGPMGLDIMLENEDKGKAWDEHFIPLCDAYTETYWGSKVDGRWWAGDSVEYPDRILIKDYLRRLFMNFFQKERVHRARIARKAAKGNNPEAGPSSESEDNSRPTWMRSHPPIRIPLKPCQPTPAATSPVFDTGRDDTPCPQWTASNKRQREGTARESSGNDTMDQVDHQERGEPSNKNPRLDRLRVLLTKAPTAQREETLPNTSKSRHGRSLDTSNSGNPSSPILPAATPAAGFRFDPNNDAFHPAEPQTPASMDTPNSNAPPHTASDVLFLTYVQQDELRNEIRLIHGSTLSHLPFKDVLEKLHKKHRLNSKQIITAVSLDFKGRKLCIEADDEDGQLDWETWQKMEGTFSRQVELEIKTSNVLA